MFYVFHSYMDLTIARKEKQTSMPLLGAYGHWSEGGGCYRAIPAMWFRDRYTDDLYSKPDPHGLWILSKLDLR